VIQNQIIQKPSGILINISILPGTLYGSIPFEAIFNNFFLQFFQFLMRSSVISRMVYMDSVNIGFCIRKAIGGARDEVWQYATL
jgi:hypothetical protein